MKNDKNTITLKSEKMKKELDLFIKDNKNLKNDNAIL
jgi:hypothetical protein